MKDKNSDRKDLVTKIEMDEAAFRWWLTHISMDEMQKFVGRTRELAVADGGKMIVMDSGFASKLASCTMMCIGRVWASESGMTMREADEVDSQGLSDIEKEGDE